LNNNKVSVRFVFVCFGERSCPILPCFPNSFGNANTLASVQVRVPLASVLEPTRQVY